MKYLYFLLFSLLLFASCDPKRPSRESDPEYIPLEDNNSTILGNDSAFVSMAADRGMFKVRLSELAVENGSAESIISFAQMIIDKGEKSNEELKSIAEIKGMSTKFILNTSSQHVIDTLQTKTGKTFDDIYTELMIRAHREDLRLFKKEAMDGYDNDLRLWAKNSIPDIAHRLAVIEGKAKIELPAKKDSVGSVTKNPKTDSAVNNTPDGKANSKKKTKAKSAKP